MPNYGGLALMEFCHLVKQVRRETREEDNSKHGGMLEASQSVSNGCQPLGELDCFLKKLTSQ